MCQFCICLCFAFGILHRPSGGTILLRALFLNFVFLFHILSANCVFLNFVFLGGTILLRALFLAQGRKLLPRGKAVLLSCQSCNLVSFAICFFCNLASFAMWFVFCNVVFVLQCCFCIAMWFYFAMWFFCNVMQSKPDTFLLSALRILKRKRYILVENMFGLFAISTEKKLG